MAIYQSTAQRLADQHKRRYMHKPIPGLTPEGDILRVELPPPPPSPGVTPAQDQFLRGIIDTIQPGQYFRQPGVIGQGGIPRMQGDLAINEQRKRELYGAALKAAGANVVTRQPVPVTRILGLEQIPALVRLQKGVGGVGERIGETTRIPYAGRVGRFIGEAVVPTTPLEVGLEFIPGVGFAPDIARAGRAGVRAGARAGVQAAADPATRRAFRVLREETGGGVLPQPKPLGKPKRFLPDLRPMADVQSEVVTREGIGGGLLAKTGINPSVAQSDPVGKALTAYARQKVSAEAATEVGVRAALDARAGRFLGGELLPILPDGKVKGLGVDWHDVFAKPDQYNLSPDQRAYIDDYRQLVDEVEQLRVDAGLKPRASIEDYIPRVVREVRGTKIRGRTRANLPRAFQTAEEGAQARVKYANPRETIAEHIKQAYDEIATKQLSDAIEPYALKPSALIPEAVQKRMNAAVTERMAAERARRALTISRALGKVEPKTARRLGGHSILTEAGFRFVPGKMTAAQRAADARLAAARQEYAAAKNARARAMGIARHKELIKSGQAPALWGPLANAQGDIPIRAWRNRYFPREWIDRLDTVVADMTGAQRKQSPWSKGLEILGNHIRFLSAVGDFAAPLTHGLPLFGRNPVAWAKAATAHYQAWFSPRIQARYIRDNLDVFQEMAQHGTPVGDVEFFNAARAEGASLGALLAKTRPTRMAAQQTFGRFQASYDTFLGMSRAELTKSFRQTIDDAAERQRLIRNMTGGLDSRALGVAAEQRGIEATWLAFSPRLLRSTVAFAAELRKPWTQGGREAWRSAAGLVTGVTGIYIATGLAMDKEWDEIKEGLNPLAGKKFLSYEVNGDWIGVGGQIRSIIQLMAASAADPASLLEPDRFDNPLLSFYAGRGAPAVGITEGTIEATTGANADPYRNIDGLPDLAKHIGTAALPFVLQNYIEGQEPLTLGASLGGLRTSAETPFEGLESAREEAAKKLGYESYADLEEKEGPNRAKSLVADEVKEERQRFEESQEERDSPFAQIRGEVALSKPLLEAAEAQYQATGDAKTFRDAIGRVRDNEAARIALIKRQRGVEELETGDPVLDGYYAVFDRFTDPATGFVLDREGMFDALDKYEASLTPEQQARLDNNRGLGETSPVVQEYRQAAKVIADSGYWDVNERVWEKIQEQSPALQGFATSEEYRRALMQRIIQRIEQTHPGTSALVAQAVAEQVIQHDPLLSVHRRTTDSVKEALRVSSPELRELLVKWYGLSASERIRELQGVR